MKMRKFNCKKIFPTKKSFIISFLVFIILIGGILFFAIPSNASKSFISFWNNRISHNLFYKNNNGSVANNASSSNENSLYQSADSYEQAVISAVKNASPAVVSIIISKNVPVVEQCPYNPFGDLPPEFQQFFGFGSSTFTAPCDTGKTTLQEVGGGSGFIISSDGLILTNKHVVSDTSASYTVLLSNGDKYPAKVLARDPSQDLAVVKIDANNLPTVQIGDSSNVQLGQTAIAIGNALGQFSNTVSVGVISGLSRTVTASDQYSNVNQETIHNVIQTDAAINFGNSGGPLLNLRGEVIGINTAIASGAQSIGFAIPINQAKRDINSIKNSGKIQVAFLGVRYISLTPDIAKAQNIPVDSGALVRGDANGPAVMKDSPAEKAGVQAEDVITKVNNQVVDQNNDLSTIIAQYNVGDTITLTINRAGKIITLKVSLEERPASK
jgi:serine protease Do